MNRIFIGVIANFFIVSHSFATTLFTNPECFKETALVSSNSVGNSTLLFSVPYDDALIVQENNILDVKIYENSFIPFSANTQTLLENITSYGQIDTDVTNEVLIDLSEKIEKESFSFQFNYDSSYHTPKYFVSEDSGDTYFQVLKKDINQYSPTNIKVTFIPSGEDTIREIIDIRSIVIKKNNIVFYVSDIDTDNDVLFYGGNTCGQTYESIENIGEVASLRTIFPDFQENISYTLNKKDSDSDGISDLKDNCRSVPNNNQVDINQNGVGDACEFDTDNDSIPDEIDNCRNIANVNQADDDNDGIGDLCDNCSFYNPSQIDADENGIGDFCDEREKYIEENDEDGDGVINSRDNCKIISNPDQADQDNDGIGDVCDNCKSYQNYKQIDIDENGVGDICEDSDNDGIFGLNDNCLNVANANQEDSDNDGVGNLCEDDDGDTIIFANDNCPYKYNPKQEDFDNDTIGDACDESDDRFLETNKGVFIAIMILVILLFLGGIFFIMRKLKQ